MRLFSALYKQVLNWSRHRQAPKFLFGLSFAESSFFPIPPDVMLAPMALATPKKAWWFATITTVASVLGGIFGYLIGFYFIHLVEPYLIQWGYANAYETGVQWFHDWGFWAVLIAGFSPIPYKVFTIAAGALNMLLIPFIIASFIGRGSRFYLVAGLMAWGGERMEKYLHRVVDVLGWLVTALVIIGGIVWYYY